MKQVAGVRGDQVYFLSRLSRILIQPYSTVFYPYSSRILLYSFFCRILPVFYPVFLGAILHGKYRTRILAVFLLYSSRILPVFFSFMEYGKNTARIQQEYSIEYEKRLYSVYSTKYG